MQAATARSDSGRRLRGPSTRRRAYPLATIPVAALGVAAAVVVAGSEAYWLCVPVAVLAGATIGPRAGAGLLVTLAVAVAATPALLDTGLGPLPPASIAVAVPLLSAAVARLVRERLEAGHSELEALVRLDPLTRLCNRRGLDDRLRYEVARHRRNGRSFALLMLDLNAFKSINERFGHSGGDELLRDVGRALAAEVREQDTVARLGGDEFCVLAPETDREQALRLEDRLRQAIRSATGGFDDLSASVGSAIFPDDGANGPQIVSAADVAQGEEKRRTRGRPPRVGAQVAA